MKRIAFSALAVLAFATLATSAFAQSGARPSGGGGGGGSGGGSSSGGGGGGSASGVGSNGNSTGSRFLQSAVLEGQSEVIRAAGQANYFNALGVKELQEAQRIQIENQQLAWEQKRAYYGWKEHQRNERQARIALQRSRRNLEKSSQIAASKPTSESVIPWPETLKHEKYAESRSEIEALARLYAKLDEKEGVQAGLEAAIRNLAKQIIADEEAGLINSIASKRVRSFVIQLNEQNGQLNEVQQFGEQEVLASSNSGSSGR